MANQLVRDGKIKRKSAEPSLTKHLTSQQKEFVRQVAKGESVSVAGLRAGYAHKTHGSELIKVPAVAHAVSIEKAKFEAEAQMDRKQVMDGLKESIEMAKLMSEPATMIQGWKTIAQMCGYMAPVEQKIKIDVTGNVTMTKLTQMTDAELLEAIERGRNASTQLLSDETTMGDSD